MCVCVCVLLGVDGRRGAVMVWPGQREAITPDKASSKAICFMIDVWDDGWMTR